MFLPVCLCVSVCISVCWSVCVCVTVETLQVLVNGSLGGAVAVGQQTAASPEAAGAGGVGPVCLPRRAETFGGFDSHQMNISKSKTHQSTTLAHLKPPGSTPC